MSWQPTELVLVKRMFWYSDPAPPWLPPSVVRIEVQVAGLAGAPWVPARGGDGKTAADEGGRCGHPEQGA